MQAREGEDWQGNNIEKNDPAEFDIWTRFGITRAEVALSFENDNDNEDDYGRGCVIPAFLFVVVTPSLLLTLLRT